MTDPIADLLTRIRNGQMSRRESVRAPYSNLKKNLADAMVKRKYVLSVKEEKDGQHRNLVVELNPEKELVLKRVSKPGQRIYVGKDEIKKVLNGYGISILSTSNGVMTGDEARKKGIGGEILCEIY